MSYLFDFIVARDLSVNILAYHTVGHLHYYFPRAVIMPSCLVTSSHYCTLCGVLRFGVLEQARALQEALPYGINFNMVFVYVNFEIYYTT